MYSKGKKIIKFCYRKLFVYRLPQRSVKFQMIQIEKNIVFLNIFQDGQNYSTYRN